MAQFNGLYRAIVTNNADPSGTGRVQVRVAAAGNATSWALPCRPVPMAVGHKASAGVPRVGDTAWVMFEGGDGNRPVWIGTL